tara:strand:- start:1502 stop:1801 length:300 start_codon:yes stop_codon:yes gene_type:complete
LKLFKKMVGWGYKLLGMPYNIIKWALLQLGYGLSYLLNLNYKKVGKWVIDVIKESIAQVFTLLGFFIAWFTLTGQAQDIVGIAIIVSTIIWLLTIRLRD